jgi:hypothetical protein
MSNTIKTINIEDLFTGAFQDNIEHYKILIAHLRNENALLRTEREMYCKLINECGIVNLTIENAKLREEVDHLKEELAKKATSNLTSQERQLNDLLTRYKDLNFGVGESIMKSKFLIIAHTANGGGHLPIQTHMRITLTTAYLGEIKKYFPNVYVSGERIHGISAK